MFGFFDVPPPISRSIDVVSFAEGDGMKVGILGGTFDPPHIAHLGLARNVLSSGLVEEVWLVPCLRHRFGKKPAPFRDRLAMCKLLIENEDHMKVSDIEQRLERPGYTLDLIVALGEANPKIDFRLVAGTDIYFQKDSWHHFEEVIRLAPPIYVARQGIDPIPEPTLPMPPAISSTDVRLALQSGKHPTDAVPIKILQYIEAHAIYGRNN